MPTVLLILNRVVWRVTIGTCLTPSEIEDLLANSLSPADKGSAEAHLADCEICRHELDDKRGQDHLFKDLQQAYAESSAVSRDRDGERPSTALIRDSVEGYEVLSEIHRGGQGVVYKAVQLATKRTVALKVLLEGPYASPKQQYRFEREIDLVATLQHPNIVTVYDSGVTRDRLHYFAMEYVDGRPLDEYLLDTGLSIDETLRLFQKICTAVSYAHQRGVIHRDIKPGNIRIDGEGEPHVLDFGLAKAAGSDLQGGAPMTATGEFMGTLAYASPEQTKGDPHLIDIRTDVYSLGVVLYEMLTGSYPYQVVGQMADVLRNIAEAEPKKPSTVRRQINDEVETIILKALAKERERRYQSAETLARDIEHYLDGEPIDAKRDSAWYVIRKSMQRHRVAAGVVLGFVLLLGVSTIALSIMYQNQSRAREEAELARAAADEARTSEETQRKLAEQRANDLQTVTEFQQSMLSDVDAEKMGRGIMATLREGIRKGLEKGDMTLQEVETSIASFDRLIGEVNATNLALNVVDENVLSRAVEAIDKDFADQPLIRASLRQTVAITYRGIALYEPAMPLQEAALQTRRRVLGDDHPDTLTSISNMGELLWGMGKYEEALPYYREALEARRRILGDDHPDTLISVNCMGVLLQSMDKLNEAEPYFRESMEGYRRVRGDDHLKTLVSTNNMGGLLKSMGKYVEAEPYYREALEGRRRVLGDDHPHTLISVNNMGVLLELMGKYEEALPYFRKAVEGHRRVLGDDHPETLTSINNMGSLLQLMGKLNEAEPYFRESMEGHRRVLGDDHPQTLASINNMGSLLQSMGKYEEALSYYRESMEGHRRVLGDDHSYTLASINNMGSLLRSMGKLNEAEPYVRESMEGYRRVLGDDHADTLKSIGNMGGLLKSMGKYEEALSYYRESMEGRRRVLGDDHSSTLTSISNMGSLLQSMGKLNEAEPYFHESREGSRRVLGDDHPDTLISINNMGTLLRSMGKLDDALIYFREALDGRRRVLGDDHPGTLISVHNMGRLMCDLGRLEEAEALGAEAVRGANAKFGQSHVFRLATISAYGHTLANLHRYGDAEGQLLEAHQGLVTTLGPNHKRTINVINFLVELYDAWHAAEPDKGYAAKASEWRTKLPRPADEAKDATP